MIKPKTQYKMLSPTLSNALRIDPAVCDVSVVPLIVSPNIEKELTSAEDTSADHLTDIEEQDASPTNVIPQRGHLLNWGAIAILVHRNTVDEDFFANLCVPFLHGGRIDRFVRMVVPEPPLNIRDRRHRVRAVECDCSKLESATCWQR
jgi:hypothetical protein